MVRSFEFLSCDWLSVLLYVDCLSMVMRSVVAVAA